jgi:hypothetical protein
VIAENLLLKQQLIVLRRARQRAPNLTLSDRLICGFGSLFLSSGRIRKLAIAMRPSTLLAFHRALVRGKSHALDEAVTTGAGCVETLELGHRYGHLSPLVAVA